MTNTKLKNEEQFGLLLAKEVASSLVDKELGKYSNVRASKKFDQLGKSYPTHTSKFNNLDILKSSQDRIFLKDNTCNKCYFVERPTNLSRLISAFRDLANNLAITVGYRTHRSIQAMADFKEVFNKNPGCEWTFIGWSLAGTVVEEMMRSIQIRNLYSSDKILIKGMVFQPGKSIIYIPELVGSLWDIDGLTEYNTSHDMIASRLGLSSAADLKRFVGSDGIIDMVTLHNHYLENLIDTIPTSIPDADIVPETDIDHHIPLAEVVSDHIDVSHDVIHDMVHGVEETMEPIVDHAKEYIHNETMAKLNRIREATQCIGLVADWKNMTDGQKISSCVTLAAPELASVPEVGVMLNLLNNGTVTPEFVMAAAISLGEKLPMGTMLSLVNDLFNNPENLVKDVAILSLEKLAMLEPTFAIISIAIQVAQVIDSLFGSENTTTITKIYGIECEQTNYKPGFWASFLYDKETTVQNQFFEVFANFSSSDSAANDRNANILAEQQLMINTFRIIGIPLELMDSDRESPTTVYGQWSDMRYSYDAFMKWKDVNYKHLSAEQKEMLDQFISETAEERDHRLTCVKDGVEMSWFTRNKHTNLFKALISVAAEFKNVNSFKSFWKSVKHIFTEDKVGPGSTLSLDELKSNEDKERIKLFNQLKKDRGKDDDDSLNSFIVILRQMWKNDTNDFSRMSIVKFANKQLLSQEIELGACVNYVYGSCLASITNTIVYFDRELEMLRQLPLKHYLSLKAKQFGIVMAQLVASTVVTQHVATTATLLPIFDNISLHLMESIFVPGIALGTNLIFRTTLGIIQGRPIDEIIFGDIYSAVNVTIASLYSTLSTNIPLLTSASSLPMVLAQGIVGNLGLIGITLPIQPVAGLITGVIAGTMFRVAHSIYKIHTMKHEYMGPLVPYDELVTALVPYDELVTALVPYDELVNPPKPRVKSYFQPAWKKMETPVWKSAHVPTWKKVNIPSWKKK